MCFDPKAPRCERPEKLKGCPKECTVEQVAECHPDAEEHPCGKDKETEQELIPP